VSLTTLNDTPLIIFLFNNKNKNNNNNFKHSLKTYLFTPLINNTFYECCPLATVSITTTVRLQLVLWMLRPTERRLSRGKSCPCHDRLRKRTHKTLNDDITANNGSQTTWRPHCHCHWAMNLNTCTVQSTYFFISQTTAPPTPHKYTFYTVYRFNNYLLSCRKRQKNPYWRYLENITQSLLAKQKFVVRYKNEVAS